MLLVFTFFIVVSCEEKDCCVNPEIELQGKFSHEIPNCDNSDNPEINCTEWLEFVDAKEVDISYGGGDIVYRFTYVREGNILSLEGEATSSFRVSFEVVDSRTLSRTDTNDIWKKID